MRKLLLLLAFLAFIAFARAQEVEVESAVGDADAALDEDVEIVSSEGDLADDTEAAPQAQPQEMSPEQQRMVSYRSRTVLWIPFAPYKDHS
jgi:hypothetical protein